jgi:hypothetical protein
MEIKYNNMKLTIKNYEKLFRKEWDSENYIEDIDERRDDYRINVWRGHMRHLIVLDRRPDGANGYYTIGIFDTTTGVSSVTHPYWIKHADIMNMDSLMDKLKLLTDDWTPKLL